MYPERWPALSARILGFIDASRVQCEQLAVNSADPYGISKQLFREARGLAAAIRDFRETHSDQLAPEANNSLEHVTGAIEPLLADPSSNGQRARLWAVVVSLSAFNSEFSFLVADNEVRLRVRSERAFAHLQRSLVVDDQLRERWQAALNAGEVQCEKLGAVHLLSHGLWAFKCDATGARTDLVFNERVSDLAEVSGYSDGLVLTEWKKSKEKVDAERLSSQARLQAGKYDEGALGGLELRSWRYIVIVSEEEVAVPKEKGKVKVKLNMGVGAGLASAGASPFG